MSAQTRAIHLPSASAREAVRVRIQEALRDWACRWVRGWHDRELLVVRLTCASEVAPRPEGVDFEAVSTPAGSLWLRRSRADCARMGEAVVGDRLMPGGLCADEWISQAVASAYEACQRELCRALLNVDATAVILSPAPMPGSLFAFGSGAIHFACERLGVDAIIDGGVWRSVPPQRATTSPRPSLTPLQRAIHRSDARLEVLLGSVELELPKLADLRCGDLLRLPKRLSEELTVLCEGQPLAGAELGELLGQKSIRLNT
jgi:flagellar motor switch/type III secretory pathway protein FliN